ncbi:MAG: hypothetical protein JWQ43_3891 [Glaciihabitans sp.]|nr:hypothetical protein [Glaciihabitans sp.]
MSASQPFPVQPSPSAPATPGDTISGHSGVSGDPDAEAWLDGELAPIPIAAGPWTLELRGASLSDIAYNGTPLLRSIRVVVRDRDWQTIEPEILTADHLDTERGSGASSADTGTGDVSELRLHARSHDAQAGIDFDWSATCSFSGDTLSFSFDGTANSAFLRNRIGIVILHRPEDAGSALSVVHPNDSVDEIALPVAISPHQPARDIAGFRWDTGSVHSELDLAGDVFEMEDQRNWTDASFKTYSTPLSIPFPVQLQPGDSIHQALTLRSRAADTPASPDASPAAAPSSAAPAKAVTVTVGAATGPAPRVWLGASTAPDSPSTGSAPAGNPAIPAVAAAVTGVLVEVDTSTRNWRAALRRAGHDAGTRPLDVRIIVRSGEGSKTAVVQVADALSALGAGRIARLGIVDKASHLAEDNLWALLATTAGERFPAAELVGGTRAHFTELNRNHERIGNNGDALSFSITPQMHDLGRDQVIESIPIQRIVAEQAVSIAAGRPVHVGPVTLRSRFNAVATSAPISGTSDTLSDGYAAEAVRAATDPRQRSRGFAAWTIASASALAVPGVASVTYAEVWGPRGITAGGGADFPVATAIGWIADIAGWQLHSIEGDLPPRLTLIAATNGQRTVLLLANLAGREQRITVDVAALRSGDGIDSPVELSVGAFGALRWSVEGPSQAARLDRI